jgi:chemotaxis protein methyltransferase CheR
VSSSDAMKALLRAVANASGLMPRGDWLAQTRRGLSAIAERQGSTVDSLLQERAAWPSLVAELMSHLTVGETYFFRHSTHFDVLMDALAERFSVEPLAPVRVLSAGCATGEEPYSVAIAVHARFGEEALARVRIIGSDINAEAIERARAASYGPWAFRDVPAWLPTRYFHGDARSGRRLVDAVRHAVTFDVGHVVNHVAGLPDGSVDAVLFRTVGIYLAPSAIAAAHSEFRRVLKPDGLLIVAPADPRPDATQFADVGHESTSVYRPFTTTVAVPRAPPPGRRVRQIDRLRHEIAPLARDRALEGASTCLMPLAHTAAPEKPSVAASVRPDLRDAEAQAMRLADRGDLVTALTAATALVNEHPTAPSGYVVRAYVALAGGRAEAAVDDLRRTLFLEPEYRLARYWYIVALQEAGQIQRAVQQSRALERLLSGSGGDVLLEDRETTAHELLDAVRFFREGLT